jgi:hypothetical protein
MKAQAQSTPVPPTFSWATKINSHGVARMKWRTATLVGATITLTACSGFCSGAGCDESFPNTLLSIQLGAQTAAGSLDPSLEGYPLEGNSSHGNEWALAMAEEGVLIGMPDADLVTYAPVKNYSGPGKLFPGLSGTLRPEQDGDRFGEKLLRVPDLNGNGHMELLVAAPNKQGGGGRIGAGAVYLFEDLGDGQLNNESAETARLRILGDNAGDHLGSSLAICPDMDGDGLPEILLAAPDEQSLASRAGRVTLLPSTTLADLPPQILSASLASSWASDQTGAQLGRAITCAEDFSGDQIPDLVLAAPFADSDSSEASGLVYIIRGGPDLKGQRVHIAAHFQLGIDQAEAYFGSSLATGDVDGDGFGDLLVGAPGANNGDGLALLYFGSDLHEGLFQPQFQFQSDATGARLGAKVGLGDNNGDGLADVFLGGPRDNPEGLNRTFFSGSLFLFHAEDVLNTPEGVLGTDSASTTWHAPQGYRRAGAAYSLGDVDGDELVDLFMLMGDD